MGKISPLDIRNQTFRTVFRGADNEEVRVFLDLVATEYESLLQEHSQLTERLRHCEDRLSEYRNLDQSLRDGVVTAERLMLQARDASQRDADLLIQDAERRAELILQDAVDRMGRMNEEIRALQTKRDIYTEQMRTFLISHMEMLDRNEQYLEGVDGLHEDATALMSKVRRADARPAPPPARRAMQRPSTEGPTRAQQPTHADPTADAPPPPANAPSQAPGRWPSPQEGAPPPVAPRFGRSGPNPERTAAPRSGSLPSQRPEPEPPPSEGKERTEGLFEISAEDDDPQGMR